MLKSRSESAPRKIHARTGLWGPARLLFCPLRGVSAAPRVCILGLVGLVGHKIAHGGSPIQIQTCKWIANQGGQRQQITLPGSGASSGTYKGYLDYVLTPNLCVGGPDGRLNDNVNVESDECRTKYKVKYLSGPAPAPTPSPGGQTCGNVCFKDSDCLTSGGFGCTRCSSYDTGAHGTATKPTRIAKTKGIKAATLPTIPTPSPTYE